MGMQVGQQPTPSTNSFKAIVRTSSQDSCNTGSMCEAEIPKEPKKSKMPFANSFRSSFMKSFLSLANRARSRSKSSPKYKEGPSTPVSQSGDSQSQKREYNSEDLKQPQIIHGPAGPRSFDTPPPPKAKSHVGWSQDDYEPFEQVPPTKEHLREAVREKRAQAERLRLAIVNRRAFAANQDPKAKAKAKLQRSDSFVEDDDILEHYEKIRYELLNEAGAIEAALEPNISAAADEAAAAINFEYSVNDRPSFDSPKLKIRFGHTAGNRTAADAIVGA